MFYNKDIKTIFEELKSSNDGLTKSDALKNINIYGQNELNSAKGKSKLKIFFNQFSDMMIIILIIVAVVMGIYGFFVTKDYTDTIVIFAVVLINSIMGYVQEEKAEVTLEGLKKYTVSNTKVRRNGEIIIIDSKYIVPGDIIILESGNKVPADARIIKESNLYVDESPLTGESLLVKKKCDTLKGKKLQIQDQNNMLFSGTNITEGRCEAIVVRTGMLTELGQIANSLNTPYEVETPLQIKIKELSKKITLLIFFILILIFIYGIINNYKLMEIIMLCSSLAVAAVPEGLPAVITITLSTGAGVLAKKNTIVRQMNAVETLGSTDIICSDKTGTITQNKMTVAATSILDDEKYNYISILANDTLIQDGIVVGDPTETSLIEYALKNKINVKKIIKDYPRILDAPFDSDRKMMSTLNEINGKKYLLVKGSLENLLNKCTNIIENKKIRKISKEDINKILKEEEIMAQDALRVIGFAYKEINNNITSSENLLKEEKNLTYVGLVGMIDPPRDTVASSVKTCIEAGIRPVMITGDSLKTACAIAKSVGIIKSNDEGILGSQLDEYTEEELQEIVKKYNVYARVSPEHKVKIVKAWQSNGKVVAMTGDGVNDAPAIKDAHVGVGMGITGTEVTKSVADIILLDDSFSTIVTSIEEGRRIFTNIRNNVVYSLSSNFAEIFTVLVGMLTGNTILLPIHILFIDLVTDSVPSICLSYEGADKKSMKQNPRGIDKPMLTPYVYANITISAIVETIFVLTVFFVSKKYFTSEVASTLALLSLVIQEIVYAFVCRNLKEMVYKQGFFSNKQLNIGFIILAVIELFVFATPVGKIINIQTIEMSLFIKVVLFNFVSFIIYELMKPILVRLFKD